jgi:hypothetical protein
MLLPSSHPYVLASGGGSICSRSSQIQMNI